MEAPDAPGKVRTLTPEHGAPNPAPPSPDRRWVPIAVAVGALVVFGGVSALLSSADDDPPQSAPSETPTTAVAAGGFGAEPPPATTTTTAPPPLSEMVPGLDAGLTIVFADAADPIVGRVIWSPFLTAPTTPLITGAAAEDAEFDVSGVALAWVTRQRAQSGLATLWTGLPPDAGPIFTDVTGVAWHDSEARRLAWTGRPVGSGEVHLYTATILRSGLPQGVVDVGVVPSGARLAGWGTWGFAVNVAAPPQHLRWSVPDPTRPGDTRLVQNLIITLMLDAEGAPRVVVPVETLETGATGRMVVRSTLPAYTAALDEGLTPDDLGFGGDVDTGVASTMVESSNVALGITTPLSAAHVLEPDLSPSGQTFVPQGASPTYRFTPDGDSVTQTERTPARMTMSSIGLGEQPARRLTSLEDADDNLGFSGDGRYLILFDREGGTIFFHDWNRGTSFLVPFELGRALAVAT